MKVRGLPFAILLAFLLAFAQYAGIVHAFSHVAGVQPSQQDKHSPAAKACEKCGVFAKFNGTLHGSEVVFNVPPPTFHLIHAETDRFTLVGSSPYQSRAPPHLLRFTV